MRQETRHTTLTIGVLFALALSFTINGCKGKPQTTGSHTAKGGSQSMQVAPNSVNAGACFTGKFPDAVFDDGGEGGFRMADLSWAIDKNGAVRISWKMVSQYSTPDDQPHITWRILDHKGVPLVQIEDKVGYTCSSSEPILWTKPAKSAPCDQVGSVEYSVESHNYHTSCK